VVCNSGVGLTPFIDGAPYHFSAGGLYNGLVLLIDDESRSYWDHITGEAVWGTMVGRRMPVWGIQMTTARQALTAIPDLLLLRSRQTFRAHLMSWLLMLPFARNTLPPGFRKTMGPLDKRLSEMEIGLGVVSKHTQRFYPLARIGAGIVEQWQGSRLHIAVDPVDRIPEAYFEDGSRPFQLFTRWYGFAFTYPACEIFGR
jgi:hypothetical protein